MASSAFRRFLTVAIGLALTASLFGGPVLAAKPLYGGNQVPFQFTYHQGSTGPPPPYGLDYCYDEDDFEEWRYGGWMLPGESFTASLRFCAGTYGGDYMPDGSPMYTGNAMFFLSLRGKHGQYAISFDGSSPTPDPKYPLFAGLLPDQPTYEHWGSCHDFPGAWVTFTVTNLSNRAVETSLRFGSIHHNTTWMCP